MASCRDGYRLSKWLDISAALQLESRKCCQVRHGECREKVSRYVCAIRAQGDKRWRHTAMEVRQRVAIQQGTHNAQLPRGSRKRGAQGGRHSGLSAHRWAQARAYSHMEWSPVGFGLQATQLHSPLRLHHRGRSVGHISTRELALYTTKIQLFHIVK